MAQHFLIFSTICFSSIVLLGGASGTEKENYNHATTIGKIKREVQDNQDSSHDGSGSRSNLNNDRAEKTAANDDDYVESNVNHLPLNFVDTSGLSNLNMIKRAPNGFTGMRGKKRTEPTDYPQNTFDWNAGWDIEDTLVSPDRSLQDLANTWPDENRERFKKTPSAFYGVRGKKYSESYGGRSNNLDELMRKVDEERLREEFLQNFLDRIATSSQYQNEIQKRTPSGFTGMRGKRDMSDMNDNDYQTQNGKRLPGNTFLGVRGKKEMFDHEAVKRSPTQHMAFFGTRGKKQPFVDFRNKFVGVRGKKSFTTSRTSTAADESSPLHSTQNIRNSVAGLFSEEIEPNYDVQTRYLVDMYPLFFGSSGKRAPNGFQGMRGKRAT